MLEFIDSQDPIADYKALITEIYKKIGELKQEKNTNRKRLKFLDKRMKQINEGNKLKVYFTVDLDELTQQYQILCGRQHEIKLELIALEERYSELNEDLYIETNNIDFRMLNYSPLGKIDHKMNNIEIV